MTCETVRDMLGAYVDGELDANAEFQLRAHLAECPQCPDAYSRLRSLQQAMKTGDLYYSAPQELEARIRNSLGSARRPRTRDRPFFQNWMAIAASVLVAISLGLIAYIVHTHRANSELLAQQVVSSHVRAMLGTHLVDVPSSDQHTVKPWFDGKLDFSPPVKDLKNYGFGLAGGRIDYLENRPVAALIYERRKHIINLFIWPSSAHSAGSGRPVGTIQGYNLIRWTDAGMNFWAVSDLNVRELQEFVALFRG
jgi:anti-sigma factor (TIGR02949 family)